MSSGLIWLALTYLMGNIMPEWMLPGAAGAAVTGLFIHDLVGLYVTPMGWGLMYFFVPLILRRPVRTPHHTASAAAITSQKVGASAMPRTSAPM